MASLPKEITVSSDVLFQELGNETVLLDLKNEIYYGLDDVGSRLWRLLTEDGNPATAVVRLLTEYEVDEATLRENISGLVKELHEARLITVEP